MRSMRWVWLGILALAALLPATSQAAMTSHRQIRGRVVSVRPSITPNTIVVATPSGQRTVHLLPSTVVMDNGQHVSPGFITATNRVTANVRMSGRQLVASKVWIAAPQVAMVPPAPSTTRVAGEQNVQLQGQISAWDPETGQLMLSTSSEPIVVPMHAAVMSQGQAMRLSDLQPGANVTVMAHRDANGHLVATRVDLTPAGMAAGTCPALTTPARPEPALQPGMPAPPEAEAMPAQPEQPTPEATPAQPAQPEAMAQPPAPSGQEKVAGMAQTEVCPVCPCPPAGPGEQPGMPQNRAQQFEREQQWF